MATRLRQWVAMGTVLGAVALLSSPWWMDGTWLIRHLVAHWQLPGAAPKAEPDGMVWLLAWAGLSLPWWVGLGGLGVIWHLLGRFQRGQLLDHWSAALLRRIGWVLVAMGPLHALGNSLALSALTWRNPPGQRWVGFALQPEHATLLVLGALLILLSRVLAEAARVEEDHRGFI